jgi:hypothetical protein
LEILYISWCRLCEAFIDLKLEESLHLDLLVRLGSWSKKAKWPIELELPPQLFVVDDVFHISQLKNCLRVPEEQVPLEDFIMSEDLTYQEYPIKLMKTSERVTRNKKIRMCKVQWSHHTEEEAHEKEKKS